MTDTPKVPTAAIRTPQRVSVAWLIPVGALLFAIWLGYSAWITRGTVVSIELSEGHGLQVGDDVRYRGIAVGRIEAIDLRLDQLGIIVKARLDPESDALARQGTRFWVVRPQLELQGIAGIETIVGPRYLAVVPGDGARRTQFIGLDEPPVAPQRAPDDLEIVLEAAERGSLRPGAPVLYRQIRVGTVISVGLTTDGGHVEARLHIDQPYLQLIRERTRFWDAGGLQMDVGISGVSMEVDSLGLLISGGVALATPPTGGDPVRTGHRFTLASRVNPVWLEWEPSIVIGSSLLPPGLALPSPLRAKLAWVEDRLLVFSAEEMRQGWVFQTPWGLLGPTELLSLVREADDGTVQLEVAGQRVDLPRESKWDGRGMTLIPTFITEPWPRDRFRKPLEPEDCLAVADPTATPLALAVGRLEAGDGEWIVDPAVPTDSSWHGAIVVAREDGRVVGMLRVEEDDERTVVALLPALE